MGVFFPKGFRVAEGPFSLYYFYRCNVHPGRKNLFNKAASSAAVIRTPRFLVGEAHVYVQALTG